MKKFENPRMSMLKLEMEDVMRTSGLCFETFACKKCYCGVMQCSGTFVCDGLDCPTLSDFD